MKKLFVFLLMLITLSACGSVTYIPAEDTSDDADTSVNVITNLIYIFATDYASSGQLYSATYENDETTLTNSGVTLLGTEARIKLFDDLLYILHAGGAFNSISTDNLQILDPNNEDAPFTTKAQHSTGNGTNPQDVIVNNDTAFISLYSPESDTNNVDDEGNPGDVIEMDTTTGSVLYRYSFYDYLQDDGDKHANATKMALANNTLYVCLQDLESNTFAATAPGLIGMIDINDHTVLGVITLQSRNPSDIAINAEASRIFVTATNDYSYDGSFGGLEIIDLNSQDQELFIADSSFEGYLERIRLSDDKAYLVVSQFNLTDFVFESKIVTIPQDIDDESEIDEFLSYGTDIRDIFYLNETLWVSFRVISTTEGDSEPAIRLYDATTGDQLGNDMTPVAAGVSITG